MLQTRAGKRTGAAASIAVEMQQEGLIDEKPPSSGSSRNS